MPEQKGDDLTQMIVVAHVLRYICKRRPHVILTEGLDADEDDDEESTSMTDSSLIEHEQWLGDQMSFVAPKSTILGHSHLKKVGKGSCGGHLTSMKQCKMMRKSVGQCKTYGESMGRRSGGAVGPGW